MTTFVTRQTSRDAIVALFTGNDSWQTVFGYMPSDEELKMQSPVLMIRSGGTEQDMASLHVNPTSYRFILRSIVLSNDGTDNWTEAKSENLLDELDREVRQVVRDNAGLSTGANYLTFDPAASQTGYSIIGGVFWRWEERVVWARYSVGS